MEHEAFAGKLPDRRDWSGWLDWRYPVDDYKMDPWGSRYQLGVWAPARWRSSPWDPTEHAPRKTTFQS